MIGRENYSQLLRNRFRTTKFGVKFCELGNSIKINYNR